MAKPKLPTKAMLAAIGLVATQSSSVEELLRELFCYLIDSPYGRIITAGEDMANLCNSCLRVAKYNRQLTDVQVEELFALVREVEQSRPLRNYLIHARWEKLDTPGEHIGIKSNRASTSTTGKGIEELSILHVTDVENLANRFLRIAQYIETFIEKTFDCYPYVHLISRDDWAKMDNYFSQFMRLRTGEILPSEHAIFYGGDAGDKSSFFD